MRVATTIAEVVTHQDIATYFAEQNIHPGYLDELVGDTAAQVQETCKAPSSETCLTQPTSKQKIRFGCLTLSLSVAGLCISLMALIMCTSSKRVPIVANTDPLAILSQTKLSRMDEQISRLAKAVSVIASSATSLPSNRCPSNTSDNINLVEVIAPKANLRIRPDTKSSAVMAVSQGVTLVVNDRMTDWIQVMAPSGELLWILSSLTEDVSTQH